jgi:hypothetical protein
MRNGRVQTQRTVRLMPVKKDRDTCDRDMRQRERHPDQFPPGQIQ